MKLRIITRQTRGGMIQHRPDGWTYTDVAGAAFGPFATEHEARIESLLRDLAARHDWPYDEPPSVRALMAARFDEPQSEPEPPIAADDPVLDFAGLWMTAGSDLVRVQGRHGGTWVGETIPPDGDVHEWDAEGHDTLDRTNYDLAARVREGAGYR